MPLTTRSWPVFETADLILGDVRGWLVERRNRGVSYRDIAEELRGLNIVVSHQTLKAWMARIEDEAKDEAAS